MCVLMPPYVVNIDVLMLDCSTDLEKEVSNLLSNHTPLLGMTKKNVHVHFLKILKEMSLK